MKLLKQAREGLRARFFETLRHVVSIDDTRDILNEAMAQQNVGFGCAGLNELENFESPYGPAELAPPPSASYERAAPIFITARFRTGSTLLWNLFRNMSGVTAYYEPFNERRWFDPRSRGARVDATHLGVGDYWAEYQGLPELANHYSEEWTRRHLFMPRNAWNPGMQRYIETLIGRASGRAVLQFNRVDLRLPWLRARFPQAKILHLYRNPRDQWCSTLPKSAGDMRRLTVRDFGPHDGFYLLNWGRDLRRSFPFLDLDPAAHPYELFYQVWKLSYAFGRSHAHQSIAYEDLVRNPRLVIEALARELSLTTADPATLAALVLDGMRGKGQALADDGWYRAIERRVDEEFRRYFEREPRSWPGFGEGTEHLHAVRAQAVHS